jgi:segregation and condensation protein A
MTETDAQSFQHDSMSAEHLSQPEQFALFVNLDGFEGPIDLLLNLAREQKLDMKKIAILPLAEQYLQFINDARDIDLEIAADYLVMAAWLAYLKSRLLHPDPEPEQNDEIIDMTDALRYQLLRLETMQQAAKRLQSLPKLGQARFVRGAPEHFASSNESVWTASLYDLLACYGEILSSGEAETLTIAATRFYSVEDACKRLRHLISSMADWTVLQNFLPPDLSRPMDVRSATASHFAASLELAREGVLRLRQDSHFAPIYLKTRDQA